MKMFLTGSLLALVLSVVLNPLHTWASVSDLLEKTEGRIVLQVESHGEAWYVDPVTKHRVYLADGAAAYELMRSFGLGISEANYTKLSNSDPYLLSSLQGRIVLRVEAHGEAYYLHPDGPVHYLKDGDSAYALMREHSLGISNHDLNLITPFTDDVQATSVSESDASIANRVWLSLVNQARVERGQAALVTDERWIATATDWASYLGENDLFTHTRPQGQSLMSWIEDLNYDFTVVGNESSWTSNYFGENLAIVTVEQTAQGLTEAVERAMDMFMSEESYNGGHYQNVINQDWNSTGVGVYWGSTMVDRSQAYLVFHFGRLNNPGQNF